MKRQLELRQKIEAGEYFEVWIYYHSLFLIYGDGDVKYQVIAPDMAIAIEKALKMHLEEFPHKGVAEESEPSYITKYRITRIPDEKILEDMWDGSLGSYIYMRHWEPDITTKELIRQLEENEGNWFLCRAYCSQTIWELDLETGEPLETLSKQTINLPERYGVEDIIRDCPKCGVHMLHHVIKNGIEMWECFKPGCHYQNPKEVDNGPI